MRILGIIILISLLTSCQSKSDKLFWVEKNTNHGSDFLFMAESTNVLPIKLDSLIYYLTKEEFLSAEKLTFKDYGTIYKNKAFNVVVLLKEGSKKGRDYTFIIRTYDKNSKIIDSYEFANWIESLEKYCFGSINKDLIIEKNCDSLEQSEIMQITNDGKIVMTSYYKP